MNKITKTTLTASALVMGLIATSAFAGIADTRHNLSTGGKAFNGGAISNSPTDEICVFCHTPHASSTTLVAPLWNKALPSASSYKVYSSGTMQGTAALTSSSASLACLSCHDGTQAMDNMINQPGSSGYNSSGAAMGNMGAMPSAGGSFIANLGTDLTNDHPVGIPYAGGGCSQPGSINDCKDKDFQAAKENGSGNGFMVGNDLEQKKNMRLYGTSLSSATVECASCHDPHVSGTKTFLRVNNAGSAVCLTCHAK